MGNSQVVELVQTLSKEERQLIQEFADQHFFNSGKQKQFVKPLLKILLSEKESKRKDAFSKEHLYQQLFGEGYKADQRLEKTMSEVHKIIRNTLLCVHYFRDSNDFFHQYDFLNVIKPRNLEQRFEQAINRLKKHQESVLIRNESYFLHQHLLDYAIFENECLHNHVKGDLNIPNAVFSLECYFYLNYLNLTNHYLLQQKVTKLLPPEDLMKSIESFSIPKSHYDFSPDIRINYEIFILLKKTYPDITDIDFLFNLLKKEEEKLDADSLRKYNTYLRNMCVLYAQLNSNDEQIREILFDLYKNNLECGYLHFEGKLTPSTYLAVSTSAVRVKQFEWAKNFIETFKNQIVGENETQDIYKFNLALYLFGTGQYQKCLETLPSSSPILDYLLHSRRLELKAYYELESDLLSYKLDAFKMFLSRTSPKLLSDQKRQSNTDFLNLLVQLSTSIPGDAKRAETLIKRLKEKKQAAEWRWLMEKAEELKHRRS
jgi:hypothetical protein